MRTAPCHLTVGLIGAGAWSYAPFVERTYISSTTQKKNEWMRYVRRTQRCGVGLKLRVLEERKTGRETREGEGRGGEERGEVECSVNM